MSYPDIRSDRRFKDVLTGGEVVRGTFITVGGAEVDDFTFVGDASAVDDFEFRFAEWRRNLVLDDLDAGGVAHHFLAVLQRTNATNVEAHGSVELERIATGGGFRAAEHDADLHTDLVDEDDDGVRALDVAGELAQRLRHETGM
jgi:hypothetical protein